MQSLVKQVNQQLDLSHIKEHEDLPVGKLAVVCSDFIKADLFNNQSSAAFSRERKKTNAPSDVAVLDSASPQYRLDNYFIRLEFAMRNSFSFSPTNLRARSSPIAEKSHHVRSIAVRASVGTNLLGSRNSIAARTRSCAASSRN